MNLNALQVFAQVARHGNLQRAAEALNLSRGAVSQRIKQLERDVGVVLLVREARGVSLTPAGQRCQEAVDAALAILETALVDIADVENSLTLHLGSSTATKWLMPRMERLLDAFPGVSIRTEVHTQMLPRNLGRNEIALWPGAAPDRNPAHQCRPLTDIRLVAVCSPDLLRPDWPMGLDTLLTLPLLQDAHRRWDRLIAARGGAGRHRLLNFDRSALALDAAIGGHGVAIAPRHMTDADVRAKRLVAIWVDPEPPREKLFLSWSRAHVRQDNVHRLVDWIAEAFGQDPEDA